MIQRLDPDTVATAAAAGDSTMLREFLARRPSEVHLYYIMWELAIYVKIHHCKNIGGLEACGLLQDLCIILYNCTECR